LRQNEAVMRVADISRRGCINPCMQELLEFTSQPKWRSAIWFAALSFAVCHIVAIAMPPVTLESALIHFAAVLLRFLLPCACFLVGVAAAYRRR